MTPPILWLLGLLTIGIVTALLVKVYEPKITNEIGTRKGIVVWGCIIMTIWVIYGGLLVFAFITKTS